MTTRAHAATPAHARTPSGITWTGIAAAVAIGVAGLHVGEALALQLIENRPPPKLYASEVATAEELPQLASRAASLRGQIENTRKRISSESLEVTIDTVTLSRDKTADQKKIRERIELRKSVLADLERQSKVLLLAQSDVEKQLIETQDRIDRKVRHQLRMVLWQDRAVRATSVLIVTFAIFVVTLPVHRRRNFSNNPIVILAGATITAVTLWIVTAAGLSGAILVLAIGIVLAAGRTQERK